MPTAAEPPLVLVIDDQPADRRLACAIIGDALGWRTREAGPGAEALAALAEQVPAVVLTDLRPTDAGGLAFVRAVRRQYPSVPIVLMTAAGNEPLALRALQRGAASYVPKSELAVELAGSLEQVVAAAQATQNRQRLLQYVTRLETEFRLENEPELIPALVSHFQEQMALFNLGDQNELIRVGVALEEVLLNAMYHGNLEVSSQLRQQDEAVFHAVIARRRQETPYRDRRVRLAARVTPDRVEFDVSDEGPGFDPASLPDPTDPANLETVGGRGLLLIRTFMDEVHFGPGGNRVTLVKCRCTRTGSQFDISV
jgi:CheY-like chemotaxis protein